MKANNNLNKNGMKRIGHVIEQIIDWGNLQDSFDTVVRGTKRKNSREGKWLLEHRDEFLISVRDQITSGNITLHNWHEREIKEGGKIRTIQVFCMKDRILINAVMNIVGKLVRPKYIRTTSSSIKGRGMHDLKAYMEEDIKRDPKGTKYCYKCDIRKFYDNIPQDKVYECLERIFKDKHLLKILKFFLNIMPHGLSMGMRSSQEFGNILMSCMIDHYVKDELGVKHYYRYCDDMWALFESKTQCWKFRNILHERVGMIGMEIKPDESVFPITNGINALGFITYPTHSRLRKRIKQTFARKLHRVKSRTRRAELAASFYGMAKHCNAKHLTELLLNKNDMKKFSELNIAYTDKNGKKQFEGENVCITQLVGKSIIVYDFETGIKTRFGDNNTVVSFKYEEDGDWYKFFTTSSWITGVLHKAREQESLPFSAQVVSSISGNRQIIKFK